MTTKINLNTSPYFDDFDQNNKFYKILFRPGRAVQARELTQIQSILQNQVARLGGFKQGDLVHPSGPVGARYSNTTMYVKAPRSNTSFTNNEEQLNMYWVGKFVENQDGVKGKVVGFDLHDQSVRLFIDLAEAGRDGQKTFGRGNTITVIAEDNSQISLIVGTAEYSTGRISRVVIPQSIYFFNDYFVLVEEQTLFLKPDNKAIDSDWNSFVTCDIGIKMTESIVRHDQEPSLLDNATGTTNYGGAGADRLRVEGVLTKRGRQTIEQNFIKILGIEDGTIVEAPLVSREAVGLKSEAEARRVYEESGNYTVSPFLAEVKNFLRDSSDADGLFSEVGELSYGYSDEDDINKDQAREAASKLAQNLFKIKPTTEKPNIAVEYNNRFYPGTSYDDVGDETSFKSLCDSMIGIKVEPGSAYVQGYRVTRGSIDKIGIKKARTSDYLPERKIQTPIGEYILITNVFGSPEISNDDWPYDDIELHSTILNLSVAEPEIPNTTTKIGSARVCSLGLQSGATGLSSAVYQLGIFDLKLDSGYTFSDVKSIYSNGKSTTGKDFLANLVLKDATKYPNLVFDGTIEKLTTPYSVIAKSDSDASGVDNPTFTLSDSKTLKIEFSELSTRDACYTALSLGTAIKFNKSNLIRVINAVKKLDVVKNGNTSNVQHTSKTTFGADGTKTTFTLDKAPLVTAEYQPKVYLGTSDTPTLQRATEIKYTNTSWSVNGVNAKFLLEYTPIETRDTRVRVHISNEEVSGATIINGINRTFPIKNSPINGIVTVKKANLPSFPNDRTKDITIDAKYYRVANGKLTFIDPVDGTTPYIPQTGDVLYLTYETYIYTTEGKSIILSQAPVAGSTVEVTYSYNVYSVDNKSITFADAPEAGSQIEYDYLTNRSVELVFDEPIILPQNTAIERIDVVKKVIGKGTTWKSNPDQHVEKGDWVRIGSGDTAKLYRVFSTPVNDNELNLDPDPNDTDIVDGAVVKVNAPWADGAKMTYLAPEDIRDMRSSTSCGLLYKLPHDDIRTIRGGSKNNPNTYTELTYTARKYVVAEPQGPGNIVVTLESNDEDVLPFSSNLYSLVDLDTGYWFQLFDSNTPDIDAIGTMETGKPETFKAKVIINLGSTNPNNPTRPNVVFKTASNVGNRKYAICIPVTKRLKEGQKTLIKGTFNSSGVYVGPVASAQVSENGDYNTKEISLNKADVIRITRVILAEDESYNTAPTARQFTGTSTIIDGKVHRDITGAYALDSGQTDYYYGIAKLKLRPNFALPKGQVRVEFDYYEHPTDRFDYFSVDSYTTSGLSYSDIPVYYSSTGDEFDLKSCLDFRPIVRQERPEVEGLSYFRAYKETPITNLVCSYHVYEGRKDLLYLTKDGEFAVKEGQPSLLPVFPSEPLDGMTLYTVSVEPYTTSRFDVILKMVDNKRYTMRDIGKLEKRIKTLEHYTTLTMLEKDTRELVVKDALGQDKFKHGFMTDTFERPTAADLSSEFTAAFDTINGELKPGVQISNINLIEEALLTRDDTSTEQTIILQDAIRQQNNYARADKNTPNKKTSLYTLAYKNVSFIEQPLCSRVININPYAVQSFVGSLKINPWTDTWREQKTVAPRITYDSSAYDAIVKNFNSNKQRIDWGTTTKEIIGISDTGDVPDGRVNVTGASARWPATDGLYLVDKVEKDANGKQTHVWRLEKPRRPSIDPKTGRFRPGTEVVKIPEGWPGAGQIVPFYQHPGKGESGWSGSPGLFQNGLSRTVTTTTQEFRSGVMSTLVDKGYVQSAKIGSKVIDISATQYVRSRQIAFEGKGFFPNTQLYAYFDDQDVTTFCVPDAGFGTVEEDLTANMVIKADGLDLKFGTNSIQTTNLQSSQPFMTGLSSSDLNAIKNDPELKFSVLTGKVKTQGTTLQGSYSELTVGVDLTNYVIAEGDILQGVISSARGKVKSISADKTKIYFDSLNDIKFLETADEQVWVKNDETVNAIKESVTKLSTDYEYALKNVPLVGGGSDFQPLVVYLVETIPGLSSPVIRVIPKDKYEHTPNTKSIRFINKTAPQNLMLALPNQNHTWSVVADYTYAGSNYFISKEQVTLSGANPENVTKKWNTKMSIIDGTLSVEFVGSNTDGSPFTTTYTVIGETKTTIEFANNIPATVTVLASYSTAIQQITGRQTKLGTKFTTELLARTSSGGTTTPGSVVAFEGKTEQREVVSITDNATAVLDSALSQGDIETEVEAFDVLEALQTKYLNKFIDVSGSKSIERNILNTKIVGIEYKPQSTTDKITLKFDSGLLMEPIAIESVSILVKKNSTQSGGTTNRKVTLKCNSTGAIKGRFCIPDPNIEGNPKFTTGDKTFKLTNSPRNENLPSVSRAQAGYSARGWIDTHAEDIIMVRRFDVETQDIKSAGARTSFSQVFKSWGEVCAADPIAQSFQVKDKGGIFITAIDVFFYSKDPFLPVRLQIRPLADGGQPSSVLLYEKTLDADQVVVNKVNIREGTVTVYGATAADAKSGFNKGPWNTPGTEQNGLYNVTSYAYDNGMSYTISDGNEYKNLPEGTRNPASIEYGFGTNEALKNAQSHMIPTRFVLDYPLYLAGDNKNYCFVLLSDSIPGDQAGGDVDVLESTYQVYFAQQGKVNDHDTLATPVHRQTALLAGEEELNLILGTGDLITRIPQADGQLFKSQNGVSWTGDPIADLKFKIHKAEFDTTKSAEIAFVNDKIEYADLELSPFQTHAGSSKVRVTHDNHNFSVGSYVSFIGVQGDLNGLMPQQIIEPKIHRIESITMDSYVIDLGSDNLATFSGNVGGALVKASTNIRFEELALIANPLAVEGTSITWRMSGIRGAGPDDTEGQQNLHTQLDDVEIIPNIEMPLYRSFQVCSEFNEQNFLGGNRSMKVIATMSSQNKNITPILDTDRLSVVAKTVRLNAPNGVGYVNNINHPLFDKSQILPSTFIPGSAISRKIWFSDTDNRLTGSAFTISYRTVTGVGSLFTVELSVGDTIKSPINSETRRVVEITDNQTLTIDAPFTTIDGTVELNSGDVNNTFEVESLSFNPSNLKFKTSDANIAFVLSQLSVGKYLSLSGTFNGRRNFYEKLITSVNYTPTNTIVDPELGQPKLCEVSVAHVLEDGIEGGYETGSINPDDTITFTVLNQYVDDISPNGTSTASKYISKELVLANPANTLKIMFDGCRPLGSDIDLYYRTTHNDDPNNPDARTWKKLAYSIENNGVLEYATPDNDPNHYSLRAYEANALQIRPFMSAQVKIVLRGGDCAAYPKVKNLRILALEE